MGENKITRRKVAGDLGAIGCNQLRFDFRPLLINHTCGHELQRLVYQVSNPKCFMGRPGAMLACYFCGPSYLLSSAAANFLCYLMP